MRQTLVHTRMLLVGHFPGLVVSKLFLDLGPQLQCGQKGFMAFSGGGGGRTRNHRFWAASRPNPAPGGLGKGPGLCAVRVADVNGNEKNAYLPNYGKLSLAADCCDMDAAARNLPWAL